MKTFYETVTFMLFTSVCLGIHMMTGYLDKLNFEMPPKSEWITEKASYTEYLNDWKKAETLGKYQLVLSPDRVGIGVEFSGYETDESRFESPMAINIEVNDFENSLRTSTEENSSTAIKIELDYHLCYESGNVYGGLVKLSNGAEKWQLAFQNIGAEGILFSDELPPVWVANLIEPIHQDESSRELQSQFEILRHMPITDSQVNRNDLAKSITGNLAYLMHNAFGEQELADRRISTSRP